MVIGRMHFTFFLLFCAVNTVVVVVVVLFRSRCEFALAVSDKISKKKKEKIILGKNHNLYTYNTPKYYNNNNNNHHQKKNNQT